MTIWRPIHVSARCPPLSECPVIVIHQFSCVPRFRARPLSQAKEIICPRFTPVNTHCTIRMPPLLCPHRLPRPGQFRRKSADALTRPRHEKAMSLKPRSRHQCLAVHRAALTDRVAAPAKAGADHHTRISLQSRRDGGPGGRLHAKRSIPVWSMVATPGLLDDQITISLAMDGASGADTYHR